MIEKANSFYMNITYIIFSIIIVFYNISILPYLTCFYSVLLCILFFVKRKKNTEKTFYESLLYSDIAFFIWIYIYLFTYIISFNSVSLTTKNYSLLLFSLPVFLFFITLLSFVLKNSFEYRMSQSLINLFISAVAIFIFFVSLNVSSLNFSTVSHNVYIYIFILHNSFLASSILVYYYKEKTKLDSDIFKNYLVLATCCFILGNLFFCVRIYYSVSFFGLDYIFYAIFVLFYSFRIKTANLVDDSKDKNDNLCSNLNANDKQYTHYFSYNITYFFLQFLIYTVVYVFDLINPYVYYSLFGLLLLNLSINLMFSYGYFNDKIVSKEKEANLKLELKVLDQIEDLKQINTELRKKVIYDSITGLYNIGSLYTKMNSLIDSGIESFYVIAINIDDFKTLNNVYGHNLGDKFLLSLANRLKDEFDDENIFLFRIDSDEFAVLFMDTSANGIENVTSRLFNLLEKVMEVNGKKFYIAYSSSIVRYPLDATTTPELVQGLSVAMNESKKYKNKKEAVYYSHSLIKEVERKNKFENYFRSVVMENDFALFIHKYYDIREEKFTVIRPELEWLNKEYSEDNRTIYQYAESAGLLDKLFMWYIDKFFEIFICQMEHNLDIDKISIRIYNSVHSVVKYLPVIEAKVNEYFIPISKINVEVKSEFLDELYKNHLSIFKRLERKGVSIVIREFGIGYTSLFNIKKLNVKKIIIDESLVNNIDMDSSELQMLKSVINIAKGLRIKIMVEGLERITQFYAIKNLDCDYASGSYIAEAEEMDMFIKNAKEDLNL